MIIEPEDIQNRIRNALSPIQTLKDICNVIFKSNNEEVINDTYSYIKNSNVLEAVQRSIDKIILIAQACDKKINDKTFDIEYYIKELNNYDRPRKTV